MEAEVDALFEDEDDDGDYDPSAMDPLAEAADGTMLTGEQQALADVRFHTHPVPARSHMRPPCPWYPATFSLCRTQRPRHSESSFPGVGSTWNM